MSDRREFLKRMAAGAAFAAPVVRTLAVPEGLSAQENFNSEKGGMGTGMTMEVMGMGMLVEPPGGSAPGSTPPWGSTTPGGD